MLFYGIMRRVVVVFSSIAARLFAKAFSFLKLVCGSANFSTTFSLVHRLVDIYKDVLAQL